LPHSAYLVRSTAAPDRAAPSGRQVGWLSVPLGVVPLTARHVYYLQVFWFCPVGRLDGILLPNFVYVVFSAVAPARAVAPQTSLGISLSTVVLCCQAVYGGWLWLRIRNIHARSMCFPFWHCLPFLSSLVFVCQSSTGWNTRNGNFIVTAYKRSQHQQKVTEGTGHVDKGWGPHHH
jgi:hypothetical protein